MIPAEVWVCARCNRWAYRIPKSWHGFTGDKDWSCKCGCTSVRLRGDGRPFGPRDRNFRYYADMETIAQNGNGDAWS